MKLTQPNRLKQPAGMPGFLLVWIGQIVSVLGSGMTSFGLTIWMYQQTKSATAMGLMQVAFITPFLLLSPIAGSTLADFVLAPAMKTHSGLANVFGPLFGSAPGAGMGLLFSFCGLGIILVGLAGYFVRPVREAESILPDHDQLKKAEETSA